MLRLKIKYVYYVFYVGNVIRILRIKQFTIQTYTIHYTKLRYLSSLSIARLKLYIFSNDLYFKKYMYLFINRISISFLNEMLLNMCFIHRIKEIVNIFIIKNS